MTIAVLRALWNFEPLSPDEVAVYEGQLLFLLEREAGGWFSVKVNHGGQDEVGIVPANYVEEITPLHSVNALVDFAGVSSTELRVNQGELLNVFDEIDGWALVQRASATTGIGYVPIHVIHEEQSSGQDGPEYVGSTTTFAVQPQATTPTTASSTIPDDATPRTASSGQPVTPTPASVVVAVVAPAAPSPSPTPPPPSPPVHSSLPRTRSKITPSPPKRSASGDSLDAQFIRAAVVFSEEPPAPVELLAPSLPEKDPRAEVQFGISPADGPSTLRPGLRSLLTALETDVLPPPRTGSFVSVSSASGSISPVTPAGSPSAELPSPDGQAVDKGKGKAKARAQANALAISGALFGGGAMTVAQPRPRPSASTPAFSFGLPQPSTSTSSSSNDIRASPSVAMLQVTTQPRASTSAATWNEAGDSPSTTSVVSLQEVKSISPQEAQHVKSPRKKYALTPKAASRSTNQLAVGAALFGGAMTAPAMPSTSSLIGKQPAPGAPKKEDKPKAQKPVASSSSSSGPGAMRRLASRFGIKPRGALSAESSSAAAASAERARVKREQEELDHYTALYMAQMERDGIDHPDIIDPEVDNEPLDPNEEFDCAICMETCKGDIAFRPAGCKHKICRECALQHIASSLDDDRYPIHCAICTSERARDPAVISERDIELAGVSREQFTKWTMLQLQALSVEMKCNKCKKSMSVDREDYQIMNIITCPMTKCRFSWCKRCLHQVVPGVDHDCGRAALEQHMREHGMLLLALSVLSGLPNTMREDQWLQSYHMQGAQLSHRVLLLVRKTLQHLSGLQPYCASRWAVNSSS
ncbi:hypothetical protein BKA62DRAFT_766797 [Auriculariales sp. MPI-PUGE-AT-0066]|nr:hypothetical protein BKA62DRAFT_766797 [Auriculariales sp. MPI-PUGE-AT-0066]